MLGTDGGCMHIYVRPYIPCPFGAGSFRAIFCRRACMYAMKASKDKEDLRSFSCA